MSNVPGSISALIDDFQSLPVKERLNLLLEFSDNLPELPARYSEHPDLLERVEECQSPIYLFVEIDGEHNAHLFFSAPPEAPTTRGFASVLHEALNGLPANEILQVDSGFPDQLGLTEAVSPLRMNGMRAMLARIKRQIREKLA
jgi:cysteine desulfuration protein SufE